MVPVLKGFVNYGNPWHIAMRRWLGPVDGPITIVDRRSRVTVIGSVGAYPMFGETWYAHDYDVPGCPLRVGDVVVDIGAHQGFFTCYAASKGAVIYAFEPHPENFSLLTANVKRNAFPPRVHAFQEAVSNHNGMAQMRCFAQLGGGCNTISDAHVADWPADYHIEVSTIHVESALGRVAGRIRLCKIDCEGAELDIVRSMAQPERVDSFALEYHPHSYCLHDLVRALTSWGTHQISYSHHANVLYAVSNSTLQEYASRWY